MYVKATSYRSSFFSVVEHRKVTHRALDFDVSGEDVEYSVELFGERPSVYVNEIHQRIHRGVFDKMKPMTDLQYSQILAYVNSKYLYTYGYVLVHFK